jgi:uroporphyrinogen decarboxylase
MKINMQKWAEDIIAAPDVKNLPVLYHSDGNLTQILPRMVELGIDAVNPMQVECNDMAEFKRLYHGKLTCFGGVDNTGVLLHGTPDDVRRHIRELFETVGKDGGLIFASHMMDKATPRENFLAMYEAMMTCEY